MYAYVHTFGYVLNTATHCNALQHTATHCNILQHTATHCNTLQHTATYCNTLQHTATHCNIHERCKVRKRQFLVFEEQHETYCQKHKRRQNSDCEQN